MAAMAEPHTDEPISDVERIRALAHPLRLDLLDWLGEVERATATECAAHLGESVASCSFHLRMLEKYGFVERAERRGREKPWRLVHASGYELRPAPDKPASYPAVGQVAALQVQRECERIKASLARLDREDDAWVQASTVTSTSFWATAEEMAEFSRDLRELVARFGGRSGDPAQRPPGARQGRLFGVVTVDPAGSDEDGAGGA
ncbi:helix-turn-helix domain-containing protein [Ornithinicoccus hortensis]|uniref:DNA-binding transcriptional ArsR family regulator n=2 Tax=Ornithinicoccus hortensis TaxID=82346 RepID=A0A542YUE2_9MICO|nr:DNA-binding transcriptional ArsR family regulator [Ornithinicoccus hortensis]